MSEITLRQVSVDFDKVNIINQLDLDLQQGKVTTIVGPNGSGKSTVLKTMSRILKPTSGTVLLDGEAIHRMKSKYLAKQLAVLPQHSHAPEHMTVLELVWLGRYPHQSLFRGRCEKDEAAVKRALKQTDMLDLSHARLDDLSGGQQQRAWIAMALAQDTPYLLLDEPTTFLDMAHQLETLELIRRLNRQCNKTIVMVLHDVNLAARYSDELILLNQGAVMAQGKPADVLTESLLQDLFNIKVRILMDSHTGTPYFIPYCCCSEEV